MRAGVETIRLKQRFDWLVGKLSRFLHAIAGRAAGGAWSERHALLQSVLF